MKRILFISLLISLLCSSCKDKPLTYHFSEGPIHGTSFHFTYEYFENKNLEKDFLKLMHDFELSLSTYNPESIISRVNSNEEDVEPDMYFRTVFNRAQQISKSTKGAFDITVAPLVNAYGFGFTQEDIEIVSDARVEELLSITGFEKVRIKNNKVIKDDPRLMLDVSAIAKGYSVDVVAMFLEDKGVLNYLVEIGGEMRCKGLNSSGVAWRVGVDKPIENMIGREIQVVMNLTDVSLATSGNYRQFRQVGDIKYSHTIDPRTGRPVTHNLLSSTVIASDCMTADAYATAFMVLGLERSLEIVNSDPELEAYFIFADEEGAYKSTYSEGLRDKIEDVY